ncbi:hypothetical protein BGZ82_010603 [Podila clonocystis]|nr:hypothetical protein BGZ82_010603 [Podila clonocystis]
MVLNPFLLPELVALVALVATHTIQGLFRNAPHVQYLIYDDIAIVNQLPLPPCAELTGIYVNNSMLLQTPSWLDTETN